MRFWVLFGPFSRSSMNLRELCNGAKKVREQRRLIHVSSFIFRALNKHQVAAVRDEFCFSSPTQTFLRAVTLSRGACNGSLKFPSETVHQSHATPSGPFEIFRIAFDNFFCASSVSSDEIFQLSTSFSSSSGATLDWRLLKGRSTRRRSGKGNKRIKNLTSVRNFKRFRCLELR